MGVKVMVDTWVGARGRYLVGRSYLGKRFSILKEPVRTKRKEVKAVWFAQHGNWKRYGDSVVFGVELWKDALEDE